jgi:hypothetical protein
MSDESLLISTPEHATNVPLAEPFSILRYFHALGDLLSSSFCQSAYTLYRIDRLDAIDTTSGISGRCLRRTCEHSGHSWP